MEFDYMAIWNSRDILIRGVLNTLLISAVAIPAGIVLGIIICFMRISSIRALRWTAIAYIEIIRNIPLLILIFMLFYALPFYGVRLSGLATGFLCLSMYGGAYFAEIFRGGIESVSKGQFDACKALGLRHIRTKPYTPKTNGKAERFIQTALREWAYAQKYQSSDRRAAELPFWLHRYNWHRPHGGIKLQTPISRLALTEDNLLRLHN